MNRHLTISEAREDLAETVNRVFYTKERVVVHRRGKDLVAVVPIEDLMALENMDLRQRSERRRKIDELVAMDDEAGLYARELEKARLGAR